MQTGPGELEENPALIARQHYITLPSYDPKNKTVKDSNCNNYFTVSMFMHTRVCVQYHVYVGCLFNLRYNN